MQQQPAGGRRVAGMPGHLPVEPAAAVNGVADDGVAEPVQVSSNLVKPGTIRWSTQRRGKSKLFQRSID